MLVQVGHQDWQQAEGQRHRHLQPKLKVLRTVPRQPALQRRQHPAHWDAPPHRAALRPGLRPGQARGGLRGRRASGRRIRAVAVGGGGGGRRVLADLGGGHRHAAAQLSGRLLLFVTPSPTHNPASLGRRTCKLQARHRFATCYWRLTQLNEGTCPAARLCWRARRIGLWLCEAFCVLRAVDTSSSAKRCSYELQLR